MPYRVYLLLCNFIVQIRDLISLEKIPQVWKRAYVLLCIWYLINYAVGAALKWELDLPSDYVFWNALYLYEALCVLMIFILFYSHFLFQFKLYVQVAGHIIGVMVFFMVMGTFSYYLEDYVDGRAFWPQEIWKKYTETNDLGK